MTMTLIYFKQQAAIQILMQPIITKHQAWIWEALIMICLEVPHSNHLHKSHKSLLTMALKWTGNKMPFRTIIWWEVNSNLVPKNSPNQVCTNNHKCKWTSKWRTEKILMTKSVSELCKQSSTSKIRCASSILSRKTSQGISNKKNSKAEIHYKSGNKRELSKSLKE